MEESKEIIDSIYRCHICNELLYIPVTIPCSHTFCRHCFNLHSKTGEKSKACPVCGELLILMTEVKVNLILRDTIENMYPELTKKRKAEVETSAISAQINNAIQTFCIRKKGFHFIPRQAGQIFLPIGELQKLEAMIKASNRCAIISDLKDDNGGSYGCISDLTTSHLFKNYLSMTAQSRIIARNIADVYIQEFDQTVSTCEVEEIEDIVPVEDIKKIELINEATVVYRTYQQIIDTVSEAFLRQIRNKNNTEPAFSEEMNDQGKLLFAQKISLYIASNLNADKRNPFILYTNDTLKRLRWCRQTMTSTKNHAKIFGSDEGKESLITLFAILAICALLLYLK